MLLNFTIIAYLSLKYCLLYPINCKVLTLSNKLFTLTLFFNVTKNMKNA